VLLQYLWNICNSVASLHTKRQLFCSTSEEHKIQISKQGRNWWFKKLLEFYHLIILYTSIPPVVHLNLVTQSICQLNKFFDILCAYSDLKWLENTFQFILNKYYAFCPQVYSDLVNQATTTVQSIFTGDLTFYYSSCQNNFACLSGFFVMSCLGIRHAKLLANTKYYQSWYPM
jgi:hypothetical protein